MTRSESMLHVKNVSGTYVEVQDKNSESFLGSLKSLFVELSDLKVKATKDKDDATLTDETIYLFTIKGSKDDKSFTLSLISTKPTLKQKGEIQNTEENPVQNKVLFVKTIAIPQPKAEDLAKV
ncbi:hypothetical protein SHELI_v1c07360 [Spiroplasma helicoides]|uniref:Uncharacterized protein n=1 Tax=Spiroplasma helicoides TaxID=216938 RepID=A0A1B3SL80_9MOLU|nr:hypothetical protein [Spiroplasma helicoides]AOG60685.1 hypothetical protein SHELI_v1c07360 [Spiroplasma helicoides]